MPIYNKNMTIMLQAGLFTSGCYGESTSEQRMPRIGDLDLGRPWVVERGIN
jgi:hypothetical protein